MIGSLMMCVSVVILLVGMIAGIAMGIQQNFVLAPAHAHLNLVGGVLLFLFGLYGGILLPAGIALVIVGGTAYKAAPIVGSLVMVLAMALFVVVVFRNRTA